MDEQQFHKRMELLKKSYDRMESQLDPADVFTQIEAEQTTSSTQPDLTPQKRLSKWQKSIVWAVSIASILLVSVLTAPFVLEPSTSLTPIEDSNIDPVKDYDLWLEEFIKTYETKREQMREELGMSEDAFKQLSSVQMAASSVEYLKKNKDKVLSIQSSDSEYFKSVTTSILENLMTPRETIQIIQELGSGLQLSWDFFHTEYTNYAQKAEEIARYYTEQLAPYTIGELERYPQALKDLIAIANKQYIELQDDGQFRPDPVFGEHAPANMDILHPGMRGHFKYLATGSLLVDGDLRFSARETAAILEMYEKTLLMDPYAVLYNDLKGEFENTWLALLKGTQSFPMRMKNGQLTEEYKDFVMRVANGEYGVAMQGKAQKIVSELKTGKSQTLTQLTAYDVWLGILLQQKDYASLNATKVTLAENWIQESQLLYIAYTETDDVIMRDTLHPLNVVKLFLYALAQEDIKTAQQLVTSEVVLTNMPKLNDLRIFSELQVTDGTTPSITAIVKERERKLYGQNITFTVDRDVTKTGESIYRISAITK